MNPTTAINWATSAGVLPVGPAATCEPGEHRTARPAFLDDPLMEAAFARAARMFAAAGDPARLRLLGLLQSGERCVSELSDLSGAKMNTVSQQLKLLRQENLVVSRRDGKHLFYALADDHVRSLVDDALSHALHHNTFSLMPPQAGAQE